MVLIRMMVSDRMVLMVKATVVMVLEMITMLRWWLAVMVIMVMG